MASRWEKVVDKTATITFGHKLIICCRSVSWLCEELHWLVKDGRACFAQSLDIDSLSDWSDYLQIHNELKQKIREKGKFVERNLPNVNNNYRKSIKAFWKSVHGPVISNKKRIETFTDDSSISFSCNPGKVKILKSSYEKLCNTSMIH